MNRFFTTIGIAVLFFSCAEQKENAAEHEPHFHSVLEKIEYHEKDSIQYDNNALALAEYIKTSPYINNEGDTVALVPERSSKIESFPCSNCHNKPIKELKVERDPLDKKAHWDIELAHAVESTMSCFTCHDEKNPDQLITLTGEHLTYDESYKVCSQCHSSQFKDWKGGAHGKKIAGWVPPKLIKSCVECHNPHSPGFEKRWPARLNTFKIKELED